MKLFLKYIGEYLKNFPQVKLSRSEEVEIRKSTLKSLGLVNINHLRDRFEGQSFLDKTVKNYGGLMACQKYLGNDVIPLEQINIKDYQPKLLIGGKSYSLHVFSFGDLPVLNSKEKKEPSIFVIQKEKLSFMICGYMEPDKIQKNLIEAPETRSSSLKYKNFIGFGDLDHIDNLKKK